MALDPLGFDDPKPITPKDFAGYLNAAFEAREKSWSSVLSAPGGRYTLDWDQALEQVGCPPEWLVPAKILLFTGYADVGDWCDEVLGEPGTKPMPQEQADGYP
jgi:hypothetical protein